jgi:hypothetical protein
MDLTSVLALAHFTAEKLAEKNNINPNTLEGFSSQSACILHKFLNTYNHNSFLLFASNFDRGGNFHVLNKCEDLYINISYLDPLLNNNKIWVDAHLPDLNLYKNIQYFDSIPKLKDFQTRLCIPKAQRAVNYKMSTLSEYENAYFISQKIF